MKYKIINGTSYSAETEDVIVNILERARQNNIRLKIHYGKDGKEWGDVVNCTIGRSNGSIKIPLEIKTKRSLGGGGLLDNCIVKIEYSNKKNGGTLYDSTNLLF